MNYLAHGRGHFDDPWFLAGTALPDWLRMLGRGVRLSAEAAAARVAADDPRVAKMAAGALRHHEDDRRFHGSAAFEETSREIARLLRAVLPRESGHRPSFVAHLLLEMQLDASIAERNPGIVEAYYEALAAIPPDELGAVARSLLPAAGDRVAPLVRRFLEERFVHDYRDPGRLRLRLDQVLRRIGHPALPEGLEDVFAASRELVEAARSRLLFEP